MFLYREKNNEQTNRWENNNLPMVVMTVVAK